MSQNDAWQRTPHIGLTYQESEESWPEAPKTRLGSPNVVLIVLDDVGFGHLGCYGSQIQTPTIDNLAKNGLQFTQFHTTSLCAPSRSCFLTGRNHHRNGIGIVVERASGFPGYNSRIPRENGFVSEILQHVGYATFAIGKWHVTPSEETSSGGPFDSWPLGRGFDRFYGFMGWETSQWDPRLYSDNHRIPKPDIEGYHLTEDLADQAIRCISDLRNVSPEKPFFLYFCPGAVHAPHHVPERYIDMYDGLFDKGWDVMRAEVLECQKAKGIFKDAVELPERIPGVLPWAELDPKSRRLFARMQAVFAGFLTHTDEQIGRVVAFLSRLGELENTLLMVVSDNGASGEGGLNGTVNSLLWFNQLPMSLEDAALHYDLIGGRESYPHYPQGWTMVGNTPFRLMKRYVWEGGVADPLIVCWPEGLGSARGELRRQYHHAIDLFPTILDCAEVEAPASINGVAQSAIDGVSMRYLFSSGSAGEPTRRRVQYYEMYGHRALWSDGWKVVSRHEPGSEVGRFLDDEWELFHTEEDPNELHDLASAYPEKVEELVAQWWVEAGRNQVLPLDDRYASRWVKDNGKANRGVYTYLPFASDLPQYVAPNVRNRTHQFRMLIQLERGNCGVLVAQGGRFGGYTLFIDHECFLVYTYNFMGLETYRIRSREPLSLGSHEIVAEFQKTGEHAGMVRLLVDDECLGSGSVDRTIPHRLDNEGALAFGYDSSSGISADYTAPFKFTGKLGPIEVRVHGAEYFDADAEAAIAMAQQ